MKLTIYRGTNEIGGTLIEIITRNKRLLVDAGYPLFLNGKQIENHIKELPYVELLELGVLPDIKNLYKWDTPGFDGVLISHAHIDHYGLLPYIHPDIPIYLSHGTRKLIELSQLFKICESYEINSRIFKMYESFNLGDFRIKPYLMDHSAFDAAAFEITAEGKTVIYTGDFRGHGRKAVCLDYFVNGALKNADILLIEGTMFGRQGEEIKTEDELEIEITNQIKNFKGITLFQTSSQNIDRLVTFYRATLRTDKTFVIDIYTANVLYELAQLGKNLPYPCESYKNIKVFYPYYLTQKIFNEIGEEYAKRFSKYHISKEKILSHKGNLIMQVRPSMKNDIHIMGIKKGQFIYSMWQGYHDGEYQKRFERYLYENDFTIKDIHTSGHAKVSDINRMMTELSAKKTIPIHTMSKESFIPFSDKVFLIEDGEEIEV